MRAMNGLTHKDLLQLKRQLEKAESDVRTLLQEDFQRRTVPGEYAMPYRESVDDEALADATNDQSVTLVSGCLAAREGIQRSIDAMHAGTYGTCEICGHQIGLKRLLSRPTATRCVDCEAGHRPAGSLPSSHP